jgi:hypothetical protein
MIEPEGISVGVPVPLRGPSSSTPLAEVGADFSDLPSADSVSTAIGKDRLVSLIASHIITHRRSDPR